MGCSHDWKPSYTRRDFICTKCGATSQHAGNPKRGRGKYKSRRMRGAPGSRGGGSRAPWIVLGLAAILIAGVTWWVATEDINMATDGMSPDVEQAVETVVGTVSDAVEGVVGDPGSITDAVIGMATDGVDDATGIITEAIDGMSPDVEQAVETVVSTVSDAVEGVVGDPGSITDAVIGMLPEAVGPYILQVDDSASNLPAIQSPEQPTNTMPSDDPPQSPLDRTIWPDPSGEVAELPQTPPDRTAGMRESSAPDTKSAFIEQVEDHVHDMTNEERTSRGIRHLASDNHLDDIARSHSQDMANRNYFDHDTPEGHDPTDRGMAVGYNCHKDYGSYYTYGLAENIFTISGVGSNPETLARQMVDSWMSSPGHRQNILESDYDILGVGIAVSRTGAVYATQNFC